VFPAGRDSQPLELREFNLEAELQAKLQNVKKVCAKLDKLDKLIKLDALNVVGTLRRAAIKVCSNGTETVPATLSLGPWTLVISKVPTSYPPVKKSKISPSCELSAR
jgi:hypothetical protein